MDTNPGFSTSFRVMRGAGGQWEVVEDGHTEALARFEAPQAAGRRIAGDAGVGDDDIMAARSQRFFQLHRERLALPEAVAGGEAVAEGEDAYGFLVCRQCL